MKMESSIESILKQTHTDGIYHTHVSMIQPEGKYQLNRQILEDFWKNYCDSIINKKFKFIKYVKKTSKMGLTPRILAKRSQTYTANHSKIHKASR